MSASSPTEPPGRAVSAWTRLGVYACFFVSGATALVFQVLWSRQFVTVFGNSSYAIGIVLCAFMAGLGLGGLIGGRLADRISGRLAAYGAVQAVVAAWALAVPLLLAWLRPLVPGLPALMPDSLLVSTLARFGLSFAILLVPCVLMGTTLPLLVRFVTESRQSIGRRIGSLYCLNTLGAALGCLAAGFWLVDAFGLRTTNLLAVGANIAIAAGALVLARTARRRSAPLEADDERPASPAPAGDAEAPGPPGWLLLGVAFLSGLAGLACEVLWVRYLGFLDHVAYAFPTILCIYLLGIGLGGLAYRLLAGRVGLGGRALALVELLLAASVPATLAATALVFGSGPPRPLSLAGMAVATVALPTLLMGMAFPLLCAVYGRNVQTLGRRIGLVYAVNTAGAVLGSLLPLFVLIPLLGIQRGLLVVAALYAAMGVALLASYAGRARRLALPAAAVCALGAVLFLAVVPADLCQRVFLATSFELARHSEIIFYREGRTGTATVVRDRVNGKKMVYINGVHEVPVLYRDLICFKMIGDLGPMLHPDPDEVLMICFGGGIAAGAAVRLPEVRSLEIVDLESSVVEAARLLSEENNGLLEDPKAHVVIDDGRNYIMTAQRRWPVIVSDATHPKSGDSWVLYTQEFYRLVQSRLTDDGVFVQWVPIHGLTLAEFKILLRTFQSVFPHASLWVTHGVDERGFYHAYSLLAATPGPLEVDAARLRDRLAAADVREDLEPFGLHTPAGFLDAFLCAEDTLQDWVGEGAVNTDDLPYTQYETRYSEGPDLVTADLVGPMEDIWPYMTGTGSEEEARRLREELAVRARANRLAFTRRLVEACALLPDDVRFRQFLRYTEEGPRYVQALVELYHDNSSALNHLAAMRASMPNGLRDAAAIYERALALDPENTSALNVLGVMRAEAGRLQEAEDYLRRAVHLSPDFAGARLNLGILLADTGRPAEARQHWQRAARDPREVKAIDQWGFCLAQDGRVSEAIEWFERAVALRPSFINARLHLARALQETGRSEEALPHLRQVLKVDPGHSLARGMLARLGRGGAGPPRSRPTGPPQPDAVP